MPKESLGYIKLEWTCPKCSTRNPGPEKTCLSCGAPQPENVAFEQPGQQELLEDQKEIEKAKAGADIHCGFCGTRNPAGTKVCAQCGADLEKGTRREAGKIVGAYSSGPVKQVECPSCGTKNPESALKCVQCGSSLKRSEPLPSDQTVPATTPAKPKLGVLGIAAIVVIGILCVAVVVSLLVMSGRTEGVIGVVQDVNWTTYVAVLGLLRVDYYGWIEEIPADAQVGECTQRVHHTQEEPAPNSNKVCGTPYTVDEGSGFAEVVQDCYYEVLQDYCSYTTMEWRQVNVVELQGIDTSPVWAEPRLAEGQRLGERGQTYTVQFNTSEGQVTYTTTDYDLFKQFQPDSEWLLNINSFGSILSVEPNQ